MPTPLCTGMYKLLKHLRAFDKNSINQRMITPNRLDQLHRSARHEHLVMKCQNSKMLEQEYIDLNDDYPENITNYYPSNAVGLSQNSNHQSTDRSKSLNFGKSWIANHISKDSIYKKKNRSWGTKKLTHFIDTMLTYDFKHR